MNSRKILVNRPGMDTTGDDKPKRRATPKLIRRHREGRAREHILEKMRLKGNKSGEMSVSNALTALTKANQVVRAVGRIGRRS
jgi:hypothetical protein